MSVPLQNMKRLSSLDHMPFWTDNERELTQERFADRRKEIVTRLESIIIPAEISAAEIKRIIHELDVLGNEIFAPMTYWLTLSDNIEDFIDFIRKTNIRGANETERWRSGLEACDQYPRSDGHVVSLLLNKYAVREIAEFYELVMKRIESKGSRLITMASVLKTEANLLG